MPASPIPVPSIDAPTGFTTETGMDRLLVDEPSVTASPAIWPAGIVAPFRPVATQLAKPLPTLQDRDLPEALKDEAGEMLTETTSVEG